MEPITLLKTEERVTHVTQCLAQGRLLEVEDLLQELLSANPDSALACFLEGALLAEKGQKQEAVSLLCRAIEKETGHYFFHHYLGNVLKGLGQHSLAEQCLLNAFRLNPAEPEVLVSLGQTFLALKKLKEANEAFRESLRLQPNQAIAFEGLANVCLHEANKLAAEHFCRAALRLDPERGALLNNYANLLSQRGLIVEAEECYQKAIALEPGTADAHLNLANLYARTDRLIDAIKQYRIVVSLKPGLASAWDSLANTLNDAGSSKEALVCWDRAISLEPTWAQALWNRSLALLKLGCFEEGWQAYEARLRVPGLIPPRTFTANVWEGQSCSGKTLLITTEQGLGDTIQFIRYVPMAKQKGGKIVVECQASLARLLDTCPGIDQIVLRGHALPHYDLHISLMSLPCVFATTLDDIPASVPYLGEHGVARDSRSDGPLKVGLAWAGSPSHLQDRRRSCRFVDFSRLFTVAGIRWFRLQKDIPAGDAQAVSLCSSLESPQEQDLLDASRIIRDLDLVISVDTSIAHLAGALAVPVWILLSSASDWRWLTDRRDSPWYPSARLFRQSTLGDWTPVIEQVHDELVREAGCS